LAAPNIGGDLLPNVLIGSLLRHFTTFLSLFFFLKEIQFFRESLWKRQENVNDADESCEQAILNIFLQTSKRRWFLQKKNIKSDLDFDNYQLCQKTQL